MSMRKVVVTDAWRTWHSTQSSYAMDHLVCDASVLNQHDVSLRSLHNVILTPHAAWYSDSAAEGVQTLAADEIDRALSGKPPRRPVH